jgi:hypothetical protein
MSSHDDTALEQGIAPLEPTYQLQELADLLATTAALARLHSEMGSDAATVLIECTDALAQVVAERARMLS